ncbi:MAG: adenylate/guanylate cyclase domain-containing protein [Paracoccaceae bacterium]
MGPRHEKRRLITILAADVVGYSRLMAADESGTFARLRAHRKELIEPKTAEYHGRVVKLTGDGALMEFASVVDAVNFAVDVQRAMAERDAAIPEEHRIRYRIGINIGDIIVDGDDIYGDGVNVAARLEGLAEPGGICVSRTVFNHVTNKVDLAFEDLGEQKVKNIPEPLRVYRVALAQTEPPRVGIVGAAGPTLTLPDKPSIAVLPFDNMSSDVEQDYFADGITEDIITELSRFGSLFVIARNTTFAFKGQSLDVKDVGRRLGVRYVVEGSVRRAGKRLRITAQLIDALSDAHLWAERYDRDLEDIFAVQDEVTRAIVTAIEPQLASTERERARRKPPENLGAWECYQRGLWHVYQHTAEDSAKGQELFRRAIELEPGFAAPHAALGFSLYYEVVGGLVSDPGDRLSRALDEARAAVAADEWNAFGHEVLGRILLLQGEHEASIAAHETALELNPNYANAHYGLGFALCFTGRAEEAVRELDEARRLSPHDPLLWAFMSIKSFALMLLRRYDEALVWARKAQQWPNITAWAYFTEVVPLAHLGRVEEARAALEQAFTIKPDLSTGYFEQIFRFKDPAEMAHVMDGLHKAGLPR